MGSIWWGEQQATPNSAVEPPDFFGRTPALVRTLNVRDPRQAASKESKER